MINTSSLAISGNTMGATMILGFPSPSGC
jgi:hypothetical protein